MDMNRARERVAEIFGVPPQDVTIDRQESHRIFVWARVEGRAVYVEFDSEYDDYEIPAWRAYSEEMSDATD